MRSSLSGSISSRGWDNSTLQNCGIVCTSVKTNVTPASAISVSWRVLHSVSSATTACMFGSCSTPLNCRTIALYSDEVWTVRWAKSAARPAAVRFCHLPTTNATTNAEKRLPQIPDRPPNDSSHTQGSTKKSGVQSASSGLSTAKSEIDDVATGLN
ncbi:hypothetical protein H310_10654 [Aphanomyces invadans]|uniref:Uncharacterized protein n=1 Tax=Aphanomyces invadans TaxID=157072 RepID=A0A024TPT0_9STRA|nr:hypothetical protein H310_10654 [Aphanomyces invadans]ETV95999.1 hypothetical protein H310_10654 [Aphanomyces invadans]|eukprot:XP_008875310.1 hypothetical protein H310_10654 [Aphanomyces invadans]